MASEKLQQKQRVCAAAVFVLALACGQKGDLEPWQSTLADCGSSLDVLLDDAGGLEPNLEASYSEALAEWTTAGTACGIGSFAGRCADGKRLLYRNGGFSSEIRYYDGERLVGFVGSGDVGICPSVCPRSRFYGDIDSVRCDSPVFESLCPDAVDYLDEDGLWMPFANGRPPGGCGTN